MVTVDTPLVFLRFEIGCVTVTSVTENGTCYNSPVLGHWRSRFPASIFGFYKLVQGRFDIL